MIEIKFLGRGGQGVVIASEILARACFEEGLYPQSFSIFGGERRGATVAALAPGSHLQSLSLRVLRLEAFLQKPEQFRL